MTHTAYVGRFAPSPTGPLHFGSLLAALASYLDARAHQGKWLVRIEDLDPPREEAGASDAILRVLDQFGFEWDDTVIYQSQRSEYYQAALDRLIQQGGAFPCLCSRKDLGGALHVGVCTPPAASLKDPSPAWRFLVPQGEFRFVDALQGTCSYLMEEDIGDFVIRRRDALWSYQLAVVVDDYLQSITHVVRGIDLIDSSIRQVLLQQALGYPHHQYSHIPVATEQNGQKLSKQNHALALHPKQASEAIWCALNWLKQSPPIELQRASTHELLSWAIEHWHSQPLLGVKSLPAPDSFQRL